MRRFLLLLILMTANLFAVDYNVFVTMEDNATKEVAKIANSLKKEGVNILYSNGYKVHLTLYLTQYDKDKIEDIKKVIDEVATNTKSIEIRFDTLRKTGGNWFMLDAVKEYKLQALSDEIAHKLIPLRDTNAEVPAWAKNIPAKAKGFMTYGSPNVFSNFDPHITLSTPVDGDKLQKYIDNNKVNFTTKITGIGVAEADSLGQFKKVIYLKEIK